MFELKDIITSCVALVALSVSVTTLYLTQLRGARVHIMAGEHLNVGHFLEGNLNVSLSVALVNDGTTTAIVRRVALLIQTPDSDEGHLLEPTFFQKLDGQGNFLHDSPAAPVGIGSKQSITKQILFRASYEQPGGFQLTDPGTYKFTILGWVKGTVRPDISDSFSVVISKEMASNLRGHLENKSGTTERIPQAIWRNWTARSLTEYQVKGLIS